MSTPDVAAADRLPVRVRTGYALGSLVTGAFGTVPGLLLLPYLTDTLAVPAFAAGLIVLLPKAWDVVFNPVAGRISDRTTGRLGPRRPYLIVAGTGLAVCFAALFAGPDAGSVTGDALYVALVFLLCATAFAFFQVPYNAMPAEITNGVHERTRLTAMRVAVLAVAILVSGAGAPAVRDAFGSGLSGYRAMGIAVGVLILVGSIGVFLGTARTPLVTVRPTVTSWREVVEAVRQCRPFGVLLVAFVIQTTGVGVLLAGVDYLSRVALESTALQPVLFAAFVGPAVLVMPAWQWIGVRRGKRIGYVVATLVFTVAIASVVAARVVPVWVVILGAGLAGVGYAGIQVFPLAMLADVISDEEHRTGKRRAGLFAGVWTAGDNLGLALGPGLYGLVLAIGGYVETSADVEVVQPGGAVAAVLIGVGLLPALFAVAALPLLRRGLWEGTR